MEYFFYCRDVADSRALREESVEAHWSFMDGYVSAMTARGPTLADDWVTQTGSMHIVDLPNAEAARVFAYEEPHYKHGVYRDVMVRRWRNVLGGKMEFAKTDEEMLQKSLAHIDAKRAALNLPVYDPKHFGRSGDARMLALEALPEEEMAEALYGGAK